MAMAVPHPLEGAKRRIAVMTSGGDAPGMNGAVRAVVRMTIARNCESYAIYEGYDGLVKGGDLIKKMDWEDVRGWLQEGGTLIGTARCAEFRERDGRKQAAKNMIVNGIDALIVCGGDGSLTGADLFREEWPSLLADLVKDGSITGEQSERFKHLNIVGLVGSIDNDFSSTDATIGCYSSLARICQAVDYIDATAFSHQRAFVIEVMGRHCGWLALMAGVSTGADYIFIPECPAGDDWKEEMCDIVREHRERGKRKTIVIVAEGAHDKELNRISASAVKNVLSDVMKLDTRVTTLGHVQRGGPPCAYDRILSTLQGAEAVDAVLTATPDTPSPVICIIENKIVRKPLLEGVELTKQVGRAIEAKDFERAMGLRDAEFKEYLQAFRITNKAHPELMLPPEKRLRIGIIHVGAPAGGFNAATRAAVAYSFARGHTPVGLHNGFPGLQRHHDDKPLGSVRDFDWLECDRWCSLGGSELGTNRGLPGADMDTTAMCFERYNIQALFIIGGFEAFTAASQLRKARATHEAFKIPLAVLPATISNNVPGTEYSVGSDTCLNEIVDYCDKLRQSASASRRRVFVVETQGGATGYVATLAGLAIGAVAVYTPEEGITMGLIEADIAHLRDQFAKDIGQNRAGKLILRNEKASKTFTTERISDIIADEGSRAPKSFECKYAVPGHVQQGGTPSPMDRVRAVRFGVRSIAHLESFAGRSREEIAADESSATIIGMRQSHVEMTPLRKVEEEESDWVNRRPKDEFWMPYREVVDTLSGRSAYKPTAPTAARA